MPATTVRPLIRQARPQEASALWNLAMRSKAFWGYSEEFMTACRDELAVTQSHFENSDLTYFVCEADAEILGFYCLARLSGTSFELDALFVEPAHIGTGIGRRLLDHAKDRACRSGSVNLFIQADPNAEAFYLAAGAERISTTESGSIPGRFLPWLELQLAGKNGEATQRS